MYFLVCGFRSPYDLRLCQKEGKCLFFPDCFGALLIKCYIGFQQCWRWKGEIPPTHMPHLWEWCNMHFAKLGVRFKEAQATHIVLQCHPISISAPQEPHLLFQFPYPFHMHTPGMGTLTHWQALNTPSHMLCKFRRFESAAADLPCDPISMRNNCIRIHKWPWPVYLFEK